MNPTLENKAKDVLENPFVDTEFSLDQERKTLAFYDHNYDKKVFDIHQYGSGNKIYFKKKK